MAKRQSVNFPGFAHSNPIPNASRIGNLMMSSVISGADPGTRTYPPTLAGQVANIFTHIRAAIAWRIWVKMLATCPASSGG